MIHFFTDPYKDELIYSAIARYHYYNGNIDCLDTLEELFGKRSIIPSLEIGSNLEALATRLGGKYTSENIINNHTIFPFYKPFLPKERTAELIKEIKYQAGGVIYTKLGMVAGSICSKKGIYYCSFCAKNEIESLGEAYIHREHQLQGVMVCHKHGTILKKYKINKNNISRIEFIRLDRALLDLRDINVASDKHQDKLFKLAKDAYYLLQVDFQDISKATILEKYKNLLYERGLTTSSKSVKQIELYEEFIDFYGAEFLETLESGIDNDDEFNWLRIATRNLERTVHPIRHLLLINFLRGDIKSFFKDINISFEPFGKGPWPCLNKVAAHYREKVVKALTSTEDYKTRLPVGTFTCECGFIYSRKGPDKTEEDKFKVGRIKAFGKLWEETLKKYLLQGQYGLRELARIMKCDPMTILKFDALLGVNYFNKETKVAEIKENDGDINRLEQYKATVLKELDINKTATRTEIRAICKKEYMYLYRKDRAWLMKVLPRTTKAIEPCEKVDWNIRDQEYIRRIKKQYQFLIGKTEPIRITKSIIGRSLGILAALEKNISKLPGTEKYLKEITETVEQFQLRRCKGIVDSKLEKDEQIRLWELQRQAGLRKEDFSKISDEILSYIEVKINGGKYEKNSS